MEFAGGGADRAIYGLRHYQFWQRRYNGFVDYWPMELFPHAGHGERSSLPIRAGLPVGDEPGTNSVGADAHDKSVGTASANLGLQHYQRIHLRQARLPG